LTALVHRLATLASQFRSALTTWAPTTLPIGLQAFPRGACGDASLLLARYIEETVGDMPEYVSGKDGNQSHGWLELNGIIIDITADQFDDVNDPVVVTTNLSWHQRFKEQSRRAVGIDDYDALNTAYQEIIKCIQRVQ
jgi:hypothetical protein